MTHVTLQEAQTRLKDLIDAAVKGDDVVIESGARDAVRLVPFASGAHRQFGSAAGKIVMRDDFDAPLADFKEYL